MSLLLSVIVVINDPPRLGNLQRLLECLSAQSIASRLELILVAPSASQLETSQPLFHDQPFAIKMIKLQGLVRWSLGAAAGLRAASAPVVVFGEDHAFPVPIWAESLVRAHEKDWVAVSPCVENGNPRRIFSRSNHLLAYGRWFRPPGGEIAEIPRMNCSFKVAPLRALPDLESALERDGPMATLLRAQGYHFGAEPRAVIHHLHEEELTYSCGLRFNAGRFSSASRSRRWGATKRFLHAFAGPLIGLRRLGEVLRQCLQRGQLGMAYSCWPALIFLSGVSALGEAVGYAWGPGASLERVTNFELRREGAGTLPQSPLGVGDRSKHGLGP